MNEYRFYLLNDERHIQRAETLTLPDEAAALREAYKLAGSGAVEVWQSVRLIALIDRGSWAAR